MADQGENAAAAARDHVRFLPTDAPAAYELGYDRPVDAVGTPFGVTQDLASGVPRRADRTAVVEPGAVSAGPFEDQENRPATFDRSGALAPGACDRFPDVGIVGNPVTVAAVDYSVVLRSAGDTPPTAVPRPPAAWAGRATLGGMRLANVRRRRAVRQCQNRT